MSTDTEFRFPTIHDGRGANTRIPILPKIEIYQTVKDDLDLPQIEEIMARPAWDFEEANLRLFRENRDRRNAEVKKATTTKRKPTPKGKSRPRQIPEG